jgi:competence protein ComEC
MMPGGEAIHKYPAVILAALVGTGIWIGDQLPESTVLPLFTLVVAAMALTGVAGRLRNGHTAAIIRSLCCILLCPSIGALKYRCDDAGRRVVPAPNARTTVTLIGDVADAPTVMGNRARFAFHARSIIADTAETLCDEKGIVTYISPGSDTSGRSIMYGSVLALKGVVESPPEAGNPGEFSPRRYYYANGISFMMRVRGIENARILGVNGGSAFMRTVVFPLRGSILSEIDRDVGGEEGEFLKGLLIGERSGLSPGVRRAFLDSGVAHILAVSGSNVAVVAATIMMLFSLFRVPRILGRTMTVWALVIFMLVTGSQPPVVRATIMALALLLSNSLARRVHPLNGVGLAALIMFSLDARQLFDVGFQLSFGAVIAILVLHRRLLAAVRHRSRGTMLVRFARQVYSVTAVSVAASLGTLPLTAIVFGRLSVVGFLANLVIVPASEISVVLGMISAAFAPMNAWAAGAYAAVNRVLLMLTIWGAEIASSVPWATMDTVEFRPVHALPYYAGLACLFCIGRPPMVRHFFIAFLCGANAVLFWPSAALAGASPIECRITMIDVGQGDAILFQPPGGCNVLIDAGPPSRDGSPWGTSVVPLLKRLGVHALDAVIITHLHDDHAGGLVHVLHSFETRRVIVTPDVVRAADSSITHNTGVISVAFGGMMLGVEVCRFYVLSPDSVNTDASGNANRRSIVVKIQYGNTSMLLMGDAEREEEERLVARYGGFLKSDVLKIGHHGSKAATSQEFLSAVRPDYALISVGRANRFGHPAGSTMQRLHASGAEVFRTDEMGAIFLATDGKTVRQVHWR